MAINKEGRENEITKWKVQWTSSTKGTLSKFTFSYIKERLKTTTPISAEFTAMITGHGLNRSYLD